MNTPTERKSHGVWLHEPRKRPDPSLFPKWAALTFALVVAMLLAWFGTQAVSEIIHTNITTPKGW